jgi:hypothetical protein
MLNAQTRYGRTNKKMISLTDEGRAQLQQYADVHGMTFSAAIETLALMGMEADLAKLLVPLLRDVVNKAIQRNFNRLAKLSLIGAAEAAMAHDLASLLMMQFTRSIAIMNPDDFESQMQISYEPEDLLDARIRRTHREICKVARNRQQRVLKTSLQALVEQLSLPVDEAIAAETDEEVNDE